jgi:hypothetical protein
MGRTQQVTIAARTTSFTAACELCAQLDGTSGWSSSTFGGHLDLDLDRGTFLCRRGHALRVERLEPRVDGGATAAA